MHGWYALDEGGPAGVGGWLGARSTWPIQPLPWDTNVLGTIAMPHGWSGAEFHLLLRDCLVFEDGDCLVLFAGVPPEWFTDLSGIRWSNLPTHFGLSAASYQPTEQGGLLRLGGTARPTGGFRLRIPTSPASRVIADRKETTRQPNGDYLLPPMTRVVRILTPSDGFR